ncbi:heterokaryon incompatibility protein-domain-containing protein [Xylariaceae sp. AK1471]|nr:heterokaryon incompatibility protein-domain-containing protein [Xylariaceae sp. AK1471]
MGSPSYPYRNSKVPLLLRLEKEKPIKSTRRRLEHWLKPPLKNETPVLCQVCRSRKLDFRPLKEEPPGFTRGFADHDDLEELERKHVVHINDFSFEEAKAARFECSLCRLLFCCAYTADLDERLLHMRCVCTLQPRYDWSSLDNINGEIIHKQQIWVKFQPIEEELVLDMVNINQLKPTRRARTPIPATINFKLLKYWLRECDAKHSHPPNTSSTLRSRTQAILSRGLFRVINTFTGSVEVPTSLPRFVALSYVWGSNAGQSRNRPVEGGPVTDYAPTIRDAAVIARSIGYEWLWVDQICIDQTSKSEKAYLIPYMKDIYEAAQLTIVAACGDSAQTGLLGSPDTPRKAENPIVLGSSFALLHVADTFVSLIQDTVWGRRGWTFEEHVFSRRLLFVFSSETFFSCATCTFRESTGRRPVVRNWGEAYRGVFGQRIWSYTTEFHNRLQSQSANMEDNYAVKNFLSALEEYTDRDLSIEADRVAAFAGVVLTASVSPVDEASEMALLRHGHPLRFFEILLTWQQNKRKREPSPIPDKPFAPSWSWASSPVKVTFNAVYNGISPDQYCWYHYESLQNHDILGLPTTSNKINSLIGLPLPDGLMVDQPWVKSSSNDLPLGYEGWPSTEAPTHSSLLLPVLHLVTLVFDARFVFREPRMNYTGTHVLLPLGNNDITDDAETWTRCEWSIHPELESCFTSEGIDSRPQPFETFAIITGRQCENTHQWPDEAHYDLYIMLLNPIGQDTYTRLGVAQLTFVHAKSYTAKVIKTGRPRWQHICII